jgi:hypothetical protein
VVRGGGASPYGALAVRVRRKDISRRLGEIVLNKIK